MDEEAIATEITTFEGVEVTIVSGDSFFFTDSARMMPFATIVTSDDGYDSSSDLNRPGVFRLNIGVSKATFQALLGAEVDLENGYDFTALDRVLPHPDYGRQYWVCILSPSAATFETAVRPLLAEAYARSAGKSARRAGRGAGDE